MGEKKLEKNRISWKTVLFMQSIVVIYTMSEVLSKMASGETFFSLRFFIFYGAQLGILAVYAVLWQQAIKRTPLSVAYANRATSLIWSMLWASFFFSESISVENILGVLILTVGVIMVNSDGA